MNATEIRAMLRSADYDPIPLRGKNPAMKKNWQWQQLFGAGPDQFDMWRLTWPDAKNTGVLCRRMPTLDLDILHQQAVEAAEALVNERYEEAGPVLVRIGRPPKRAIIFRTDEPFPKILSILLAPDGSKHKIEFLSDGQQVVVAGIHPDTGQPYTWHGGKPGEIQREELPYIREAEAQQLVADIVALLTRDFGFVVEGATGKTNGGDAPPADWEQLVANITSGADYHDSITKLAASYIARGHSGAETIKSLRGLMKATTAPHDDRWKERYREIPRAVQSAQQKFDEPVQVALQALPVERMALYQVISVFDRWLAIADHTALFTMLGTVAANMLPGDPVWLGIIAPPSSAKTELLNSLSRLQFVFLAEALSPAALLSCLPRSAASSMANMSGKSALRVAGPSNGTERRDCCLPQLRNTTSTIASSAHWATVSCWSALIQPARVSSTPA
jgi:hypothetical protein